MSAQVVEPSLMARLRAETRPQHDATEAIPFSAAILEGSLPLASYAAQLAAYVPVHASLERALTGKGHPAFARVGNRPCGASTSSMPTSLRSA